MKFETSVVYLEQVPKIIVDTGFDWATFWSFSATVTIFVLGTYLTVRNFNKTIASQEKVARANSELQQRLIATQEISAKQNFDLQKELMASQDLAAKQAFEVQKEMIESQEVVAAQAALKTSRQNWINDLRDACAIYISAALNVQRLNLYREAAEPWGAGDTSLRDWSFSHIQAMKELVSLKAKIELLVNPSEPESQQLLESIKELHEECDQAGGPAKSICENVVAHCQTILKMEWEKAKSGK
jgi:carboxypeptidase C (cathepsin A)